MVSHALKDEVVTFKAQIDELSLEKKTLEENLAESQALAAATASELSQCDSNAEARLESMKHQVSFRHLTMYSSGGPL